MAENTFNFELFYNKEGFNKALTHFNSVSELLGDFESKKNLADVINDLLLENEIDQIQVPSIIYALLVEKYKYIYKSINLKITTEKLDTISDEMRKWNGVDVVMLYHHPELGVMVINPKNSGHWKNVTALKKNELLTIYAGGFTSSINKTIPLTAIDKALDIIENKKTKVPTSLLNGSCVFRKKKLPRTPARKQSKRKVKASGKSSPKNAVEKTAVEQQQINQTQPAKMRMTRQYSVLVTNELFHNGNVEAWKKIIESFTTKHPGLRVFVFYDGERIHDINTLFKWGKVKHGSAIMFAVAGENITDVAKLQRYLRQGASPSFEAFLRYPVNKILNLF